MASLLDPHQTNFNNRGPIANQAVNQTFHEKVVINQTGNNDSQLLKQLPYAEQAGFDASTKQHTRTCLPHTRSNVLAQITDWADAHHEQCIFWLNGMAGTGKSTIALTVAREYARQQRLGGSFFFSRGGGDLGSSRKLFTTLARQLAYSVSDSKRHICEAIQGNDDIGNKGLYDQWNMLILQPLSRLSEGASPLPLMFVIDALDECEGEDDVRLVLQLLATANTLRDIRLRIFITSRPEIPIRYGVFDIPETTHQDFILHNIDPVIVDNDISLFLKHHLGVIRRQCGFAASWPGEEVIELLVKRAGGLFIYAATVCRFLQEDARFTQVRLDLVLKHDLHAQLPEKKLDEVYTTVLISSVGRESSEQEKNSIYQLFSQVVGSIAILFDMLSTAHLAGLLGLPKHEVVLTLDHLHSVLEVPESEDDSVRLLHPSFRDFLLNKNRCVNPLFAVNKEKAHRRLFTRCLEVMSKFLRRDMCDLRKPGARIASIDRSKVNKYIPLYVQYACRYWVHHLHNSNLESVDYGNIQAFLEHYFFNWLEALAVMACVSEGVVMVRILDLILVSDVKREPPFPQRLMFEARRIFQLNLNRDEKSILKGQSRIRAQLELQTLVHDAKRFILNNRAVIEKAPLQIYHSALLFSPKASILRKKFWDQAPSWISRAPCFQDNWDACLQVLEGHSSSVNAVAFSPDGQLVASASDDCTVRLWDTATLEGHSDSVSSVAFSPDGKQVASGSYDSTVRLWDARTGVQRHTLAGHSGWVKSVAFSPDGQLVASASTDSTVKLWDTSTGAERHTLAGHLGWVRAVAFSPDGQLAASASDDCTVKLWDTSTGAERHTLAGHSDWVKAVAFSPGGQLVASASNDGTVKLWDARTGAERHTLANHSNWVNAVAFSPDGQLVASASNDGTVKLWDARTGAERRTLAGHSRWVNALAFSSDGQLVASASDDNTVRLWDVGTGPDRRTLAGHSDWVNAVAFSPDGQLVTSASKDGTVKLWDARTGGERHTLAGHSRAVIAVAFSPEEQLVASASDDCTVRLWDTRTGAERHRLAGHSGSVNAVAFSPDGQLVASASDDSTVKIWDARTGAGRHTLAGHSRCVSAVAFSSDGQLVASASYDGKIKLWDVRTGLQRHTLAGHSSWVNAVAFSPDGQLVASASDDRTVMLWDTRTGAERHTLAGDLGWVRAVAFSPDGQLVASAVDDCTVKLWDARTGRERHTLASHSMLDAISFSSCGRHLKSNMGVLEAAQFDAITIARLVLQLATNADQKEIPSKVFPIGRASMSRYQYPLDRSPAAQQTIAHG